MATDSRLITNAVGDDAAFRVFVNAVHGLLATSGLLQTADTGQVDRTAVTRPAVGGTGDTTGAGVTPYEVFKLPGDTADDDVFIKVEYGVGGATGNAAAGYAKVWFTVGMSTDGAGTIGALVQPRKVAENGTPNLASYTWRACAQEDTFWLMGATPTQFTLMVMRPHDDDGSIAETAAAVFLPTSTNQYGFNGVWRYQGGTGTCTSDGTAQNINGSGAPMNLSDVAYSKGMIALGGKWKQLPLLVIAETAASELVVATIAGRRYVRVPTNNGGNVNGYGPRWFSGCAALLPWE